MACQIPVIDTRSGGTEEIINDKVSGLLVDAGSAKALAEGILLMLHNASFRKQLAVDGRKSVSERFSLNATLRLYQNLFNEILGVQLES